MFAGGLAVSGVSSPSSAAARLGITHQPAQQPLQPIAQQQNQRRRR
ncbi:MAG: hypothetical protein R2911_29015 [Caldilineaceae bacterium]